MRDLMNNIDLKVAIAPLAAGVADNTPQVSTIFDTKDGDSATLAIITGTLADADATFTVLLEEGNTSNLSDAVAVADIDLIGTEALASFVFSDDLKCRKLGYKGGKRYIRATITPALNASAAPMAAIWIKGHLAAAPASNPPV